MSDAFSRRGFFTVALGAGAALALPRLAHAHVVRFTTRLEPVPDATRLIVMLHVRHGERSGVELPSNAIRLDARLDAGGERYALELHKEIPRPQRMSRGMPSLAGRTLVIAPDREEVYGRFVALWPRELSPGTPDAPTGTAELVARAALLVGAERIPERQRASAIALGRLVAAAPVTLPA